MPWYADTGKPTLSHQRKPVEEKDPNAINEWYDRGAKGATAKKYRKGACENCGALTHKRKDCLERPRKKGAKFTNKDIAADEIVRDIELGYDAKRDRWNGYDASEHKRVYEEYEAIEAERQRQREEEIDNQTTTDLAAVRKVAKAGKAKEEDPDFGSSEDEDADEDKYADSADAVGQKMDTKTRITVRNLRIREDTAKYLINLDPESAYYDPKTRSMRENPLNNVPPEEVRYFVHNPYVHYSHKYRLDSPATISCATLAKLPKWQPCRSTPGKPSNVATTSILTRTPHKVNSYINNIKRRRRTSVRSTRVLSWPSTAARNILIVYRRSCCQVRQRSTLSTLGRVRSFMDVNERWSSRNILKMVSCDWHIACLTFVLTIDSIHQQPHGRLGLVVRP